MKPQGAKKLRQGIVGRDASGWNRKGGRASEKRIAGLIAELDERGSADDALREATRIMTTLPRATVTRG